MLSNCGVEKTLETPLDSRVIKTVNPKGDQPWTFIGRTDDEAEVPVLWPPGAKSWFIGKDPDAWKDWGHEEKGTIEDEMVGWHHGLNGHEFEQAPGDSEGQWSLVCCSPWGHKELGMTKKQQQHPRFPANKSRRKWHSKSHNLPWRPCCYCCC